MFSSEMSFWSGKRSSKCNCNVNEKLGIKCQLLPFCELFGRPVLHGRLGDWLCVSIPVDDNLVLRLIHTMCV